MPSRARALLFFVPLFAASCADSTQPVGQNGEFLYVDAAGDVRDVANAPVVHDLRRVSGYVAADTLVITLGFAGVVDSGMDGFDRELIGVIHFDTDENPQTGGTSLMGWNVGFRGLGADYGLHLQTMTLSPMVPEGTPGTVIRTEWLGKSVRLHIALALLGPDDGSLNMSGLVSPPVAAFDYFPGDSPLELRWTPGM